MSTILALDVGYGDTKVVLYKDGKIEQLFKFPSVIGITKRNEFIQDNRIYDFRDHSYYVAEAAMNLPSENIIDITDYKNLEYYAPLFLYYTLKLIGETPDIIVSGLSKAQIENSGNFKEGLMKFEVNDETISNDNIFILPQGAGSKLCIDKYGNNFPNEQHEFNGDITYVGIDIGSNTIDTFLVTDGKTSPNLFEGIEREGVMKIATKLAKKVKEMHGRQITLHEAKQILDTDVYHLRGQKHDFKEFNQEIKKEYIKELLHIIETKYGKVLDKCSFISLSGGGSTFFKSTEDGFIRIPKDKNEFYNAIGFALFGANHIK